jgi:FKBP-type peptidyl-prolyl cis-trans isomerase FklB
VARLFTPSELAYGERGSQGAIGPNEALVFDIELLEVLG